MAAQNVRYKNIHPTETIVIRQAGGADVTLIPNADGLVNTQDTASGGLDAAQTDVRHYEHAGAIVAIAFA